MRRSFLFALFSCIVLTVKYIQTLVVSQWTGCLALVSDYLTEAGVLHVKLVLSQSLQMSSLTRYIANLGIRVI
jgi:hypothetical protein